MKSFVSNYFDGKSLDKLKKTITPGWNDKNLRLHLGIIDVPDYALNILEIGCGIGRLLIELAKDRPDRTLVGLDASHDMIKEGRKYCKDHGNIQLYNTESRTVDSFPEQDFIFAFTVFQHIPDTQTVLDYVRLSGEILAPGGDCFFQLLRDDERPDADLWSWHDPECLADVLEDSGCEATINPISDRWIAVEGYKHESKNSSS